MELIALIFVLWLIGCLFPGSSGGYADPIDAIACLVAGVTVVVILFCAYWSAVAGIIYAGEWLGFAWQDGLLLLALFGPIVIPMVIAVFVNVIAERRTARTLP